MTDLPGVTVCIPCYNQAEYLQQSLLSALAQTVPPAEVIIIDDGSDLEIVVPSEPDDYPHIPVRVVRVTNRGLVGARNCGLMLARTAGYLPLDADDWLEPDYIERTLPLLAEADVVVTGIREHEGRTGVYKPGFDRPWNLVTSESMRSTNLFYYASLFRTEMLRSCGGYNSHMNVAGWEDWDLWHDLLDRRARFAAVEEPLFNYRCRPGSMAVHAETQRRRNLAEMARHHGW